MGRLQQAAGSGPLSVRLHSRTQTLVHKHTLKCSFRRQKTVPICQRLRLHLSAPAEQADMKAIWISVIKHATADAPGYPVGKLEMFGAPFISSFDLLKLHEDT